MRQLMLLSLILFTGLVNASPHCAGIHTWHNVTAKEGQWNVILQPISQQSYFADAACNALTTTTLSTAHSLIYGFGFSKDADFDIAYTLTAVKQEASFQSKACVFVITAKGPAQPDITALSYHGAVCEWSIVPGIGEDFVIG
ncbi:hypothetical protein [Legionella shakespearei]|uniref:Uncharacterized protein n=1 Tax=Legionella shakespearei DSM 23087 TaxID=1122169 RepID=A0A0W0YHU5_9GAMM|nr:hypothetical protein [Legionella shakespearei]KTD56395.1 hypothetical protein Lsha_2794 [Legionella shakespearei DSM 23087]